MNIVCNQQQILASNIFILEEHNKFLKNDIVPNERNNTNRYCSLNDRIYETKQKILFDEQALLKIKSLQSETKNFILKSKAIGENIKKVETAAIQDDHTLRNAMNKVEFLKNEVNLYLIF